MLRVYIETVHTGGPMDVIGAAIIFIVCGYAVGEIVMYIADNSTRTVHNRFFRTIGLGLLASICIGFLTLQVLPMPVSMLYAFCSAIISCGLYQLHLRLKPWKSYP